MMLKQLKFATLLSLAVPFPVAAQTMTAAEQRAVQSALNRGQLIYAYDQAAWHGTDDLSGKAKAAGIWETLGPKIGGWVVVESANDRLIIFFDKDVADPHALYKARFTGGGLVEGKLLAPTDDLTIGAEATRLIAAKRTAADALAASNNKRCVDRPFNTVVLPPEAPGAPTLVYFLTPQTKTDEIPMGGHYRVMVTAEGKAGEIRRFTNSCVSLPAPTSKDGKKPEALAITHLLDPTPTEIHVFSMFAAGLPLYVGAGADRVWVVESSGGQARIRLLPQK